MADISLLSRLVNGVQRNVDISSNTLVMSSLKLGTSELTKATLDLLALTTDSPSAVDASAQHHHDGRYRTQTELSAVGGAALVGADDTGFSNISGATAQAMFASVDSALDTAGSVEFLDSEFRINDNSDITKQIAFEASAITTGTLRTITMPDTNVNLGDIATNASDISTLDAAVVKRDGSQAFTADQSMGNFKLTNLAAPVSANDAARLADVQAAQAGQIPKDPVELVSTSNITLSGEQTIDGVLTSTSRVLVAGQTNQDENGIYDTAAGAWARAADADGTPDQEVKLGNTTLVTGGTQYANTVFYLNATDAADPADITPGSETQNWIEYSRAESTTASQGITKVGLDFRLADAGAANGIAVSSGAISISLATDPGLEFSGGQLRVLVDPSGALERVAAGLDVADGGINAARLASNAVETDKINNGAVTADKIGAAAVTNAKVNSDVFDQDTITGGAGSAGAVQHAPALQNAEVAGEAFPASGVRAVRYGNDTLDTPETAGRVYLADPTELTLIKAGGNQDPFHVIGLAIAASQAIAAAVNVVKNGLITATSHGLVVGQPCYLDSSGALTSTAPTTTGEAVVKVGVPKDANTIDVNIQIMGVN